MAKDLKAPRVIDIEWEGKIYPFRVWTTLHGKTSKWVWEAEGNGEYGYLISIRWVLAQESLEEIKRIILCGFKNQRADQQKRILQSQQSHPLQSLL